MKYLFALSGFVIIVVSMFIAGSCIHKHGNKKAIDCEEITYFKSVPPQPGEDTWKFIEELKSPLWSNHGWKKIDPGPQQADLSKGVTINMNFPDPEGRLETAYDDLNAFFAAGTVSCDNGRYMIETAEDKTLNGESFLLDIRSGICRIVAGDIEGVRRGIYCLEDEMLRLRGPFLPIGKIEKKPVIIRRISRCFFGPIKRPPKMRDELMDDVNYYPDQYLNRLAHEGVNGLWLTVEFSDLVSTKYTPGAGTDASRRLAKLKQTVDACLRYGIRTYIFCIEPRAWDKDNPVIKMYPELAGAPGGRGNFFCPMSKTAYDYLYQSVNKIFRAVPELGGMINITHGERGTTCLSSLSSTTEYNGNINCPLCSDKEPWEILHASLSAMERGMHDAAPAAELISWLYMPQPQRYLTGDSYKLADWVYDLPAHTPDRVIVQFNFESGITGTEFGKLMVGGDYWISKPGPSERFERIARVADEYNTRVSAKIQTGNSHEVATVPYVPLPSLLYRKFKAMKDLGVSHTMLCWYFGNYPGLMNKAAGLLSMEPFPENEDTFLNHLASICWREEDVEKVVEAWKLFSEGYENYPLVNLFQYYGPIHDGPVWPLLLKPADAPLSPTWQIGSGTTLKPWPPSGDRIGECLGDVLTLDEVVELTQRMTSSWDKGVEILTGLKDLYKDEPERLLDIGVAQALGIQLKSGHNILEFYLLREKMFRMEGRERLAILKQLSEIISQEILLDEQLLSLCEKDSRLGFHSEAEGYKYYPEKIKWRMEQLNSVLLLDIPEVEKMIRKNQLLFPEYTGMIPVGPVNQCIAYDKPIWSGKGFILPETIKWQSFQYGSDTTSLKWGVVNSNEALYLFVTEKETMDTETEESPIESIEVKIEPDRLYPAAHFVFNGGSPIYKGDPVHITGYPLLFRGGQREIYENGRWYVAVRIPFDTIGSEMRDMHPIRMDVRVQKRSGDGCSWRPNNPVTSRLILGSDNPADLGWLVFRK